MRMRMCMYMCMYNIYIYIYLPPVENMLDKSFLGFIQSPFTSDNHWKHPAAEPVRPRFQAGQTDAASACHWGFMKGVFWLEVLDRLGICSEGIFKGIFKSPQNILNAFKRLFGDCVALFKGLVRENCRKPSDFAPTIRMTNNSSPQPILGVVFWTTWTSMNHLVCDVITCIELYRYVTCIYMCIYYIYIIIYT